MKKYKLIKEYPGSPKLNTIRNWSENTWSDNNDFTENKMFMPNNYPEFWELVVEKDYEILSLVSNNEYCFLDKDNLFKYKKYLGTSSGSTLEQCFTSVWKINSVKRLSDGEIFTIGDKIEDNVKYDFDTTFTISRIELDNNKIELWHDQGAYYPLTQCEKVKQPFFITEDKVEISEGNYIYSVETSLNEIYRRKSGIYKKSTKNHPVEHWYKGDKYFSTREAAQDYIFLNKPCLSLKDVASIYVSATKEITDTTSYTAQNRRIQDLVKEKLKL